MDRDLLIATSYGHGPKRRKPPAKVLPESVKQVRLARQVLWRQESRDRGAIYPEVGWDIPGKCLDRRPAPRNVAPTTPPPPRSYNPPARGRHVAKWLAANAAAVPGIVSVQDIIRLLPVNLRADLPTESLVPIVARQMGNVLGFVRLGEVPLHPLHGNRGRVPLWTRASTAARMEGWKPEQIAEAYSSSRPEWRKSAKAAIQSAR